MSGHLVTIQAKKKKNEEKKKKENCAQVGRQLNATQLFTHSRPSSEMEEKIGKNSIEIHGWR